MPKSYPVTLRCAKSTDTTQLVFQEVDTGRMQPRFMGRNALAPDIRLNDFRCSAVVDWLDVLIRAGRPTHFMAIKRTVDDVIGRSCHVKHLEEATVSKGTVYRVRFQEPRLVSVQKAIEAVVRDFGCTTRPTVAGMEVSFDFTPKVPSDDMRRKLIGVLQRHHLPSREMILQHGTRPRFSWGNSRRRTAFVMALSKAAIVNDTRLRSNDRDNPPPVDATYYVGSRYRPPLWRTMDKILDQQNRITGQHVWLPDKDKRVRIEVALGSEQLEAHGIRWLEDLEEFNFVPLQKKWFQFMQPTFVDTTKLPRGLKRLQVEYDERERRKKFLTAGVLALDAMDGAIERDNLKTRPEMLRRLKANGKKPKPAVRIGKGISRTMVAYAELNAKAETALRHLGPKFRGS